MLNLFLSLIVLIDVTLYRSQARLQRLGEQLGLDAGATANEDDIGIDMLSDEENLGNVLVSPQNDKASPRKDQYKASPSQKRTRVDMVEADDKSKLGIFHIGFCSTNIYVIFP